MSANRAVSIAFMLFASAMFVSTFNIELHSFVQGVSARFWPQSILVFLFGLSLSLFITSRGKEEQKGDEGPPFLQTLVCCMYFAGYIVGLQIMGYVIATLLFQVFFLLYMEVRNRKALVLIPVITTAAMMGAFKGLLNVLLPAGVWIFEDFNRAVWM